METETRALLIVDVQPTFCEGGALGVDGGNDVAEKIADFVTENADEYAMIVTTQDWHIDPGEHFSDNPDFVDSWPPHGVAGTAEAELHEDIASLPIDDSVKKGEYAAAYSGFEGKNAEGETLEQILRNAEVTAVDVVGIAESHCVKETALDALKSGWPVRVFSDLTVPTSEELGITARQEMDEAGVEQVASAEAFGFYEEDEDVPLPGGWDDEASAAEDEWDSDEWDDDLNGDGIPDSLEDDEYGAADFHDDELPPSREVGLEQVPERDHYGDDADPELTSDGEEEELEAVIAQADAGSDGVGYVEVNDASGVEEDLEGLDLSEFDLDELDVDEDVDFSDEVDDGDFDFTDIEYKPGGPDAPR